MNTSTPANWLDALGQLTPQRTAVLITVMAASGSTPRAAGTRMLVTPEAQYDTIGGGHLEWKVIAMARIWLAETQPDEQAIRKVDIALGPGLGQCCGGAVSLQLERVDHWSEQDYAERIKEFRHARQQLPHLYLFGAGHVGSALVQVLQQVPCRITWVDERDHLFPASLHDGIQTEATDIPEAIVAAAEPDSYFLVMTHHHGLDLRLCEQILKKQDAAWFGLIGSHTKRVKFERRLQDRGLASTALQNMVCPIGIPEIGGKEPGVIAVAVAAQLLQLWSIRNRRQTSPVSQSSVT